MLLGADELFLSDLRSKLTKSHTRVNNASIYRAGHKPTWTDESNTIPDDYINNSIHSHISSISLLKKQTASLLEHAKQNIAKQEHDTTQQQHDTQYSIGRILTDEEYIPGDIITPSPSTTFQGTVLQSHQLQRKHHGLHDTIDTTNQSTSVSSIVSTGPYNITIDTSVIDAEDNQLRSDFANRYNTNEEDEDEDEVNLRRERARQRFQQKEAEEEKIEQQQQQHDETEQKNIMDRYQVSEEESEESSEEETDESEESDDSHRVLYKPIFRSKAQRDTIGKHSTLVY